MSVVAVKKATLLAVPIAASVLLAGCGGNAKPDASSSTSVSAPTTTPSATATTTAAPTTPGPTTPGPTTDPNIPAGAREHTPAGADAFVKYFIEQSNVAWTVPRAGILSPLCQASSKSCAAYEETATRLVAEGHRYDGDPVTVKFIGTTDATRVSDYDVIANLVQERRSEIDAAGKIIITDVRMDLRLHFVLLYTAQAWSVSSIKLVK